VSRPGADPGGDLDVLVLGGAGVDTIVRVPELPARTPAPCRPPGSIR